MNRTLTFSGSLSARRLRGTAPLSWRLRNTLRPGFLLGWTAYQGAKVFSALTGLPVMVAELRAVKIHRDGHREDFGVLGYRVVTTAGVNWLVDAFQGSVEPETMKYHGCGTGTNAEAVGDTALQTESTTALNPDSTRATGSLEEGASANIFKTIGTLTFDASAAVTEHGVFNQAATGGGTLWDRSQFAAINVVSGDSIQFTYQLTCTAGG